MFDNLKGFGQFISIARGFMILTISVGASFLMGESLVWFEAPVGRGSAARFFVGYCFAGKLLIYF